MSTISPVALLCEKTRIFLQSRHAAPNARGHSFHDDRYRPLGDSRYGTLHAGKLPLIRDGARFALRLAGLGLSLLGEGRQVSHTHIGVHNTCPHVFSYVLELM